ncbi:hypothetical protein MACH23_08340 [Sulfitobacter pontiacus]|nr:hypothetical protein MACH23_08340 [Sulfitobacter pontiacus]
MPLASLGTTPSHVIVAVNSVSFIVGMTGILSRCVVRNLRKAATKEKAPRVQGLCFRILVINA